MNNLINEYLYHKKTYEDALTSKNYFAPDVICERYNEGNVDTLRYENVPKFNLDERIKENEMNQMKKLNMV